VIRHDFEFAASLHAIQYIRSEKSLQPDIHAVTNTARRYFGPTLRVFARVDNVLNMICMDRI